MTQELLASTDELNLWTRQTVDDGLATLILEMVSSAVVAVTGTAGASWDAQNVPGQVKMVVLSAAGRVATNPQGLRSETIGAYSYTAGDTGGLFTATELAALQQATGADMPTGVISVPLTVTGIERGHSYQHRLQVKDGR